MKRVSRWIRGFGIGSGCLLSLCAALAGASSCINRPVTTTEPQTSNLFVDQVPYTRVDQIDMLFVVDNSVSMSDKQQLLKKAVPNLLRRTLTPPCVDPDSGAEQPALAGSPNPCPAGWHTAFPAVEDVHIAVVSSSLGTSGGGSCAAELAAADDHARLLPSVRAGVPSWNGSGYLLWDPQAKQSPPGHTDIEALIGDFSDTISAVNEVGCGYESTLEAWYRFLVDPEPPLEIVREGSQTVARGIDEELLRQRAEFLRPDSLLVIVMLSDEDDCSIGDTGAAWLMTDPNVSRPHATSACQSDPTSPCCRPCTVIESAPPAGCPATAADPACALPEYALNDELDHRNLRCADQKRRFGMEFLHPTSRYVAAITEAQITSRSGALVKNPLFHAADGTRTRGEKQVLLAGIVGVPWQDVASSDSLSGPGLRYLGYDELDSENRWQLMASDPLLQVSSEPRSGNHPLLGVPLAPATSTNPLENPINGHEYVNTDSSDLQYACIFPLERPVDCDGDGSCDCNAADIDRNRPLCQPPTSGLAETRQYFAKAYPAPRHLEVLRGVGENGVVASICPKLAVGDWSDPAYGYNPALDYLAGVIGKGLERCLPRTLDVEADGSLPCKVAESTLGSCDCSELGRTAPSTEVESAVRAELELGGHCGAGTGTSCDDYCVCEIVQATGDAKEACETQQAPGEGAAGYCYVDAELGIGNPELVGNCPPTERRTLRFVGEDIPKKGSVTFMACAGATLRQAD